MAVASEGVCRCYKNYLFRTKIIANTMGVIIAIFTLSLVVCLTLDSNKNGTEVDQDESLEEIPDRQKRDAKKI